MIDDFFGVLFGMLPPKVMAAIVIAMLLAIGAVVLWAQS
jgi:hypothetical protein